MTDQTPNPNTPSWGQPAPQHTGWTTPPLAPRPPKKHKGLKITLGVVGAVVAIGIIGAIAGGGKDDKTTSAAAPVTTSTTQGPAATPTTDAPAPAPKAAAPAPKKTTTKPKPVVVLTEKGSGIKSTKTFTVDGDWDLAYTYNCAKFGFQGNFIVSDGGLGIYVNELGKKGSDVTHLHDGDEMHLEINSECSWTVTVTDIP